MSARRSPGRVLLALEPALRELAARIRRAARYQLVRARASGSIEGLMRPVSQGVGDVAYALDVPCEREIERWHSQQARRAPISVLTEDTGWRHLGPGRRSGVIELDGFDHGGARIAIDPVDGTRNLMADLRPAWTVISCAPPGVGQPRLSELRAALVSELPQSGGSRYRVLSCFGRGAEYEERSVAGERLLGRRELRVDRDGRADHGYFPFFRYTPAMRPALARLEAEFFRRLEREEGAELRHVYDDQYICNAGQLVLLSLGTYRMIVDARALLTERLRLPSIPSKPYDMAGAILIAREAGCVVLGADGGELDFPIDATTPVHFAGFANWATAKRLLPHLKASLRTLFRSSGQMRSRK